MASLHQARMTAFAIVVALLTACGYEAPPDGAALRPVRQPAGEDAALIGYAAPGDRAATDGPRHTAAAFERAIAQPADPTELRITFEQLLGHHATLAVRFMRARVDGADAFARVAVDALVTNTEQLTEAVQSVYGPQPAAAFEQLWSDHVTFFFDYTVGLAESDTEAMRDARADLDRYADEFGALMESVTDGNVAAAAVAEGLDAHIDHLLGQIDAYAAGDYATAFTLQRQAYAHMFPTGQALAEGATAHHPGELPLPVDDAPQQLRSALGLLLGEHVELAIDAMQAGVTGAPHFEQAAAALNDNTREITEAMDALFGAEAAADFNTLWADHIDAFVQYTAALAESDEEAKQAALHQLHEFHSELGQRLSDMTGGQLPADAAAETLRLHDEQLVEQIESYAAEDYEAAYQVAFDAYQHVFDAAAALSGAIEAHLGPQLPLGGAPTGGGGTAEHSRD